MSMSERFVRVNTQIPQDETFLTQKQRLRDTCEAVGKKSVASQVPRVHKQQPDGNTCRSRSSPGNVFRQSTTSHAFVVERTQITFR